MIAILGSLGWAGMIHTPNAWLNWDWAAGQRGPAHSTRHGVPGSLDRSCEVARGVRIMS